jgi:hypothetical protein
MVADQDAHMEANFLAIGYVESAHGKWVPPGSLVPCDACNAMVTDGEYEDFHVFGPCRVDNRQKSA